MRLFVGIELSAEMRDGVLSAQETLRQRFSSGVRWSGYEQLHVTLKFIGEVSDERAADISGALHSAVTCCAPCRISLSGAGVFPHEGAPCIVWCGLSLTYHFLWETVEHCMDVIGFPRDERGYVPHITIGRIRDNRWTQAAALRTALGSLALPIETQDVSYVSLFQSHKAEGGSVYSIRERFPLLGT